jgi:carbamoylphosphate synthase large subunit
MVTGVGGPAGLATAAFFREKGFTIIGTDIRPVDCAVDKFFIVPKAEARQFPEEILRLIHREKPALFIPTVTEELPVCARLKASIVASGCKVFISQAQVADILNDKYLTSAKLRDECLAVPRTFLAGQFASATTAGDTLGYPFVAKPRHGRGGRGVAVIHNAAQAGTERRRDVVYQEFVEGKEFDANLFAYPAGVVQSVVVLWKSKLKDGIVGNATAVEMVEHEEVAMLASDTVRKLKLEGPLDMDVRLDGKGSPKILEINGRVGANALTAKEMLEAFFRTMRGGDA